MLPRVPVGGLLNINNLWSNKIQSLPDNDCNKALNPGAYTIGEGSKNYPKGFFSYGLLLVYGENIPGKRLAHICLSANNEFAIRSRTIPVTGPITEFGNEWTIK